MKKATFTFTVCTIIFSTMVLAQKSVDVDTRVEGDKKIIKIRRGDNIEHSRLNLTDEQKKEFKKLDLAFEKETLNIKNELGVKKLELDVELDEVDPNLNKINSLIDDIHKMEASIEKKRIASEFKKRDLLTDEQKKDWSMPGHGQQDIIMLKGDVPEDLLWLGDEPPLGKIERKIEIKEK